jgi:hypothetical protein
MDASKLRLYSSKLTSRSIDGKDCKFFYQENVYATEQAQFLVQQGDDNFAT